jgi:hypothetical protein
MGTHSRGGSRLLCVHPVLHEFGAEVLHRSAGFALVLLLIFAAEIVGLLHAIQFAVPILCGIIPNVDRIESLVDVIRLALLLGTCPTVQCLTNAMRSADR